LDFFHDKPPLEKGWAKPTLSFVFLLY